MSDTEGKWLLLMEVTVSQMWEVTVSEKEAYCMWSFSTSNQRELIHYGDMAILAEVHIARRANMSLCPAGLRLFMDTVVFP